MIGVFCAMLVLMSCIFYRTYALCMGGGELAQAAQNQSTYTLEVARTRGMIYDCAMRPLVNAQTQARAAVLPSAQSAQAMRRLIPDRDELFSRMEDGRPFVAAVPDAEREALKDAEGITLFEVPSRYGKHPTAVHIIGHLQDGTGVYGLEQAYDAFLKENGGVLEARYNVDALGRALTDGGPELTSTMDNKRGLVLTIDERIQRIAEYSARNYITKGAVVVMECDTGNIRACVSLPEFDPTQLTASFDAANSPFVNKAFATFSVGSGFKLVVTAAALEAGITPGVVECTGSVDVSGQVFHCNNRAGHGTMDLRGAVEQSCNPYFIELAREVGAARLRETALEFGFGEATPLAPGYGGAAGTVPSLATLKSPAALANFGFGQGELTATPLQLARMVSVFANGGLLVEPRLVEGISDESGTALAEREAGAAPTRIISENTANRVRELMLDVVEEGSGKRAKPQMGGAGGKTGSAQTGRYYDEARENEIVEAWFVGFFPAEQPKYTVVVLAQGADSGSTYAAPIFKDIADAVMQLQDE